MKTAELRQILLRLRDKARAWPLAIIGLMMIGLIVTPNPLLGTANPTKLEILAWLVCKESVLAYLGYWVDRLLYPNSRPGQGQCREGIERMAAEKRRAFIVAAALLAGGLIQ